MRPPKAYGGVLRRKMPSPLDVSREESFAALLLRVVALADHHELDLSLPGTMKALLAMGWYHVEGFKVAKKPGRKPSPKQTANDIALFVEVLRGREKGQDDTRAYRRIAKRRGVEEDEIEKEVVNLRKRFNDLTQPKTEVQRRASMRMRRMIPSLGKEEKKK